MQRINAMLAMPYMRVLKIIVLCLLAAGANFLLSTISVHVIRIPLYLDTVFSVALCFSHGLIPGLVTALFTHTLFAIRDGGFTPFIICSIAEVLIVWRLKPVSDLTAKRMPSYTNILGSLLFLYLSALIAVSVLGGLIDFFYHSVFSVDKFYFSPEDTIKISLLRSNIPILAMNILSRIPVNIVDRFIVIFTGYFIGRGLLRKT